MFGMNGGIINQFLGVFGFTPVEWLYSVDYAMIAVIIANIWIGIPFNMILLLTGLTTIPADIYESCDIDGAKGLRRLFSITIPMIRPAIMSVLTLGFVYTFKVFDLVKVMTSGGPVNRTQLVSIYAYKLAFEKYNPDTGEYVWNGFNNFKDFIISLSTTTVMPYAIKNSLTIYLVGVFIGLPLNLIFAFFLYKKVPGTGFFRVVLFLPQILSGIVTSVMFAYFVEGALPAVFTKMGATFPDLLNGPEYAFRRLFSIVFGLGSVRN
jgi:ABC-type sugar transport system permease subunit